MKTCTKCNQSLPLSSFYKKKSSSTDGLMTECKSCHKRRVHERHVKLKHELVAICGGKCELCGYQKEPRILNFHHKNPKTKSFGIASRNSAPLKTLLKEAKKCMLLCPNCHQELHLASL